MISFYLAAAYQINLKMTINMSDAATANVQYYLQHLIAPRPIALASTVDKLGNVNLSPFSFFNMFSSNPPIVIFSPARRLRNNTTKHTLDNLYEVPEVVINIVTCDIVHQASLASCEYPKGTDEFLKAGFTKQQASFVQPPIVKEAKASLECRVNEIKSLGENGGAGQLVIAEVICAHISDELLCDDKRFLQDKLKLVARLGGDWYARISADNLFKVPKPNSKIGIGIDALPDHIRMSNQLTGNHLAQLANVSVLPEKVPGFRDDRLEALQYFLRNRNDTVHAYAKELIEDGKVEHAWQVLLCE